MACCPASCSSWSSPRDSNISFRSLRNIPKLGGKAELPIPRRPEVRQLPRIVEVEAVHLEEPRDGLPWQPSPKISNGVDEYFPTAFIVSGRWLAGSFRVPGYYHWAMKRWLHGVVPVRLRRPAGGRVGRESWYLGNTHIKKRNQQRNTNSRRHRERENIYFFLRQTEKQMGNRHRKMDAVSLGLFPSLSYPEHETT